MHDFEKKFNRIKQARSEMPIYCDFLDLYQEFLVERERFEKTLDLKPIKIDSNLLKVKMEEGFPLLDRRNIPIEANKLKEYLLKLIAIVKKRNEKEAEKIENAIKEEKISIEKACRSFLREEDYLKEEGSLKLDSELLSFLTKHALIPLFEFYAKKLAHHLKGIQWDWGHCPICGGRAKMAELRGEEGKRFLLCSLCNYEWPYSRLRCPFCNNEDQEKLSYFSVEEKEGFRVDLCMKCKEYIKTLDSRKFDREIDLEIDDITTLHLDILAQKEGYKRSDFVEVDLGGL